MAVVVSTAPRQRQPHLRSSVCGLLCFRVVLLALLTTGLAGPAGAAAASANNGLTFPSQFEFHGVLAGIPGPKKALQANVLAVDEPRRRLYAMYQDVSAGFGPSIKQTLNTYDLVPEGVPALLDSTVVATGQGFGGNQEPYSTAFDPGRRHLLMSVTGNNGARVDRVDLVRRVALPPWDITAEVPGFSAVGMTYAQDEDRVYMLGEFSGTSAAGILLDFFGGAFRGGPAVVSLDAKTGELVWARPVPECQQPLVTFAVGSLIARSDMRDALYFFCHPGGSTFTAGAVGARNPGQSALLRLNIDPRAEQADALDFDLDVFPVSGNYKNGNDTGVAAFDAVTDRFIVQSRAPTTPGAWVFDGRLDAWVGFVTAPDNSNSFIGVNPSSGRHYMASGSYVNVSDVRLSPVPQGDTIGLNPKVGFGIGKARVAIDGPTRRLFPSRVGPEEQIAVIEDTTPSLRPEQPLDYDSLTSDVPIRPGTLVQYAGGASGFGANVRVAGGAAAGIGRIPGVGGDLARTIGVEGVPPCVSVGVDDLRCVSGGDRQITVASVPTVDLRSSGASAQAMAVELDANTDGERDGTRRSVQDRTGGDEAGPAAVLAPPFRTVTCLDGGGDRQDTKAEHPAGSARAVCDLAKESVTAMASAGDLAGGPVAIASSSFDTSVARTANAGAVTESHSVVRGLRIGQRGTASLTIGKVTTVARTVAGGRPGTASARWERRVSGVSVTDPGGREILSDPGCTTVVAASAGRKPTTTDGGDCAGLTTAVNDVLKGRVMLRLPTPRMEATPRGAFAAVGKTQRDFLQASTLQNDDRKSAPGVEAIVLNDGEEKSRLVVQLSAVEASSIFTISQFGSTPRGPNGPTVKPDNAPPLGGFTGGGSRGNGSTGSSAADAAGPGAAASLDDRAAGALTDTLSDLGTSEPEVTGPDAGQPLASDSLTGAGVADSVAAGLRWIARSPQEAALVALVWLLVLAALSPVVRRLFLLRQLSS